MPRNAKKLSVLSAPAKYRDERDRAIALEYVRRGEGHTKPAIARDMGVDHSVVYRAIRRPGLLEWAREELGREVGASEQGSR